jgi:hypothetical protein
LPFADFLPRRIVTARHLLSATWCISTWVSYMSGLACTFSPGVCHGLTLRLTRRK